MIKNINNPDVLEKEELVYLARLAEQSEMHQEMLQYVKLFIAKTQQDLTLEERSIVSVAFKSFIGSRRTS